MNNYHGSSSEYGDIHGVGDDAEETDDDADVAVDALVPDAEPHQRVAATAASS